MDMGDLRLYAVNVLVMMLTMSNIEVILKILLLLITIGYTAFKWISIAKEYKKHSKK